MQIEWRYERGDEKDKGIILIRCPSCLMEQELKQNDKGNMTGQHFNIDREGFVTPEFVCMNRGDKYCPYTARIRLAKW